MSKNQVLTNMAVSAVLVRNHKTPKQIIGTLLVYDGFGNLLTTLRTLELPDKNNTVKESCIPIGKYFVTEYHSTRYGKCFKILEVPNRNGILIHQGNFYYQTLGCILVGTEIGLIDADNLYDVKNSIAGLMVLRDLMHEDFFLTIVDGNNVSGITLVY